MYIKIKRLLNEFLVYLNTVNVKQLKKIIWIWKKKKKEQKRN